jgi:RNase H-fold protein (predicted Holliday junction resolvase)
MSEAPADKRTRFIGIDPGTNKCGFAVVYADGERKCLDVVPTLAIADRIESEMREGVVAAFCVGHATSSDAIVELCRRRWPDIPRRVIDETNTTLLARRLYYDDHPPKGLWRFVPRGLLVPKEPLDGYAAALIVERYRKASVSGQG